ncbi:MAG: hypothetical protein ACKPCI_28635 [Dolichospermum sp.]
MRYTTGGQDAHPTRVLILGNMQVKYPLPITHYPLPIKKYLLGRQNPIYE